MNKLTYWFLSFIAISLVIIPCISYGAYRVTASPEQKFFYGSLTAMSSATGFFLKRITDELEDQL